MKKRIDAIAKLKGKTLYTADYKLNNMLYGLIIESPINHGIIINIDFSSIKDECFIITSKDIPGKNKIPEPVSDQEYLASNYVFYKGQPLAVILHKNKQILSKLAKKVKINYSKIVAVTSPIKAMLDKNLAFGKKIVINNQHYIEEKDNWIKIKKTYYTPHQEQLYLEPQSIIANYNKSLNKLSITGSMQVPFAVKTSVENILGDTVKNIEVETADAIGGAFGGKEDFPNLLAGLAAICSYKTCQPVIINFSRNQDIAISTKRHPSLTEITSFTNPTTLKIEKMIIDFRLDAGAFQTISPVVLARGVLHAGGAYSCPSVKITGQLYKSHTPPNGAFRGFGAPQGLFAIESHIDDIANKLNVNSLDLRLANMFIKGSEFPSTQIVQDSNLRKCFEKLISWCDYQKKQKEFNEFNKNSTLIKKGIGLSVGYHGGGYTGNGEKVLKSKVKIKIDTNKNVNVLVSNVEMGQGASTTLAQIVANTLGYDIQKTFWVKPNTSKSPNSGPTVASRTIYIVGNLLKQLCTEILQKHGDFNNFISSIDKEITFEKDFTPPSDTKFDEEKFCGTGYKDYSYAACACELEFNTVTAVITVKKLYNVLDVGKVINLEIAEGQVMGGVTQALGYATTEYWHKEGIGRGKNFAEYVVPVSTDIPNILVKFINTDSELAKGLGELPMDYPAAAIRNAFANASNIYLNKIPLTPENIIKSMPEF